MKNKKITKCLSTILILISALFLSLNIVGCSKSRDNVSDIPVVNLKNNAIKFEVGANSIARAIQFDVEQADCGLIQISRDNSFKTTIDNFNILVDIGVPLGSGSKIKNKLIKKIQDKDVNNIDLMVFSHMHYDHIGAATDLINSNKFMFRNTSVLLNWSEVKYFWNKASATTKKLINEINDRKFSVSDCNFWSNKPKDQNKIVSFIDAAGTEKGFFSVLGGSKPPKNNKDKDNPNAWSIVNRFEWNNKSILYTGDLAGTTGFDGLPHTIPKQHKEQLNCDILKSPHHGSASNNSNSKKFLNLVSPTEIWISTGNVDKYTLPDKLTLERYKKILNGLVEMIKGTNKFGGDSLKKPEWKEINQWINNNPKVNNKNIGYGDISLLFSK